MTERVVEGVWRLALPSPTLPPFRDTNAYLLARRGVGIVVDPGGDGPDAEEAVVACAAAAGVGPKGIVLTHTHRDHLAGVDALLRRWPDLAVWVHPEELDRTDPAWRAVALTGGRRLTLADAVVEVVHTPGHSPGHVALWLAHERLLLAGDLVAGRGSIWVGLPDGDLRAYGDSLARAAALDPLVVAPAHGPVRRDGAAVLHEAREHRLGRERAVLAALSAGPLDLAALRDRIYAGVSGVPDDPLVTDLAERSLLAQLRELMRRGRVMHAGSDERGPYLATGGVTRGGGRAGPP